MDVPRSTCWPADMPSCSPRCMRAPSPAVLGRSTAWHLPSIMTINQHGALRMQRHPHKQHCRIMNAGRLAVSASCSRQPAAPLSLKMDSIQQNEPPNLSANPPRRKSAMYALLSVALVLACAAQSQPGPALASLTMSSGSLGKEGACSA